MTHFSNAAPRNYASKLEQWLGPPSITGRSVVGWEKSETQALSKTPYLRIIVRDEYIPHDFPAKHHDFVYSYASVKMTSDQACALVKVSGSILIDLLKNEVGARCGGLGANDATLSFVLDVVQGKSPATKEEYASRINNEIVSRSKFNAYKQLEKANESDACVLF